MKGNRGNRVPLARRKFADPNYDVHGWSSGRPRPLVLVKDDRPTEFERVVAQFQIPEHLLHTDPRIRRWVHQNKNYRYVPEFLLAALGERVVVEAWK